MARKEYKNSAFTLIELLVVIAIIGILSSVVLASLSGARASARDSQRVQKIRQIRTAVEMYINDNGNPPLAGNSTLYSSNDSTEWSTLASELEPSYINNLPVDPVNSSDFKLEYRAGGSDSQCNFDASSGDSYHFIIGVETSLDSPWTYRDPTGGGYDRYCLVIK